MRPAVGGGLAEAVELGGGGVEADLEPLGFTEPPLPRASRMHSRRVPDDQISPWTRACRCSSCHPSACSSALRMVPSREYPALSATRQDAGLAAGTTPQAMQAKVVQGPLVTHSWPRPPHRPRAPRGGSSRRSRRCHRRGRCSHPISPTASPSGRAMAQIALSSARHRSCMRSILRRASSGVSTSRRFHWRTPGS